jgi:peptidyl-dipeptidase Dcp
MTLIKTTALALAFSAQGYYAQHKTNTMLNPLLQPSALQYHAPAFDLIQDAHFKPALEQALQNQNQAIAAIASQTQAPTFENTVQALEASFWQIKPVKYVFDNLCSANINPLLQDLQEQMAPVMAKHNDNIFFNAALFARIQKVYQGLATSKLDAEDQKLCQFYYHAFVMAGAQLPAEQQAQLKDINQEEAVLNAKFGKLLLEARKNAAVLFDSAQELDGLSADEVAAAAKAATDAGHAGKFLLKIENTTQQDALVLLNHRPSRERLYKASLQRAEKNDANDTRSTILALAQCRLKKAQLFGLPNYASWVMQDQMAQKPENAAKLLKEISGFAFKKAQTELKDLELFAQKTTPGLKLEAWDWNYYAEKLKKERYHFEESEIKAYFELNQVLEKGVFYAAQQVYDLSFKRRTDLPVYHPDVKTYEVFDKDGKSIAIYYLDFYTRDNKSGGAWMSNFLDQDEFHHQKPVITNVFNYKKPLPGKASLIGMDDVNTMFHEFGHTLHGLLSKLKYASLSGTNVPRDFVEYPSQINEHFATEPNILKNYALHYQTQKPLPKNLLAKFQESQNFNQGYINLEKLAAATIDLAWHSISKAEEATDVNQFETNALKAYNLYLNQVPPRYHSSYFNHIWGGGYASSYYAYIWSEVLDHDSWDWFAKHGGATRQNGDRFRQYILSVGNLPDLNQTYKAFTGSEPSTQALLKNKNLIP